jgi:hypothetical protein
MNEDVIAAAVAECTEGRDPVQGRVAIFEKVRDIPYQYPASRDPAVVLQTGGGSCSGKHYLLGEMLRRQGLEVRHMICSHRFNDSSVPFPEEMQEMLRKNEILDLHDYLQISVDGSWVDVDATWSVDLRDYGFPVNEEWDGCSSMLLTVVSDEHELVEGDPAKAKEELLSHLTPRQRKLRDEFLVALSAWIQEIAAEAE